MDYISHIKKAIIAYESRKFKKPRAESLAAVAEIKDLIAKGDEAKLRTYINNLLDTKSRDFIQNKTDKKPINKEGTLYSCLQSELEIYKKSLLDKKPVSAQEQKQIKNRYLTSLFFSNLASNSLKQTKHRDQRSDIKNINEVISPEEASFAFKLLENARLTINFNATSFFKHYSELAKKSDALIDQQLEEEFTYQNKYEASNVEHSRRLNNEKRFLAFESHLDEIKKKSGSTDLVDSSGKAFLSDASHKEFDPSMRPKYGALDFLGEEYAPNGPATSYGRSYFVMKDYVKDKSTFTAGDSGQLRPSPDAVSTRHDFTNVLRYASPELLELLLQPTFFQERGYNNAPLNYVEAQIHMKLHLLRDVKSIYLDPSELKSAKLIDSGSNLSPDLIDFIKLMAEHDIEVKIIGMKFELELTNHQINKM